MAPITTLLKAGSEQERMLWIAALRDAIAPKTGGIPNPRRSRFIASKGTATQRTVKNMKAVSNRSKDVAQMAKLDRDQLKLLKVPVLRDILSHLDVDFDRKSKEIIYLVDLIINQQRLYSAANAFKGGFKQWRDKAGGDSLEEGLGNMRTSTV